MKIGETYQYSAPKFGMSVIASKKAFKYLNTNLNSKQALEINQMCKEQLSKKPDINLHMGYFSSPTSGKQVPFLRASVNDKIFEEGLFQSSFNVVKNAINYAKKFQT